MYPIANKLNILRSKSMFVGDANTKPLMLYLKDLMLRIPDRRGKQPGGSDEDSDDDEYGYWVYKITGRNRSWTVLTTLHKYLGKLYFLNKELQAN